MDRQPKMPSPWLTPALAVIAFLFSCLLWPYIQMRHWKEPSVDYASVAENVALFVAAWGLLGWAVRRNILDARRAIGLRAYVETIKDEHQTQMQGLATRLQREAAESRSRLLTTCEHQKADLETSLKRDYDQAISVMRVDFASEYGKLKQQHEDERDQWSKALEEAQSRGSDTFNFHPDSVGLRIESALFGAKGDTPKDVRDKVHARLSVGETVPVSWQFLLGYDPHPYATKYLTVTFSITAAEAGEIAVQETALRRRLYLLLDQVALNLKELQNDGKLNLMSKDNWTNVGHSETVARASSRMIDCAVSLGEPLNISFTHLRDLLGVQLLHEVEKARQNLSPYGVVTH